MSKKDNMNQRETDRDVKPQKGQESNVNWDERNDSHSSNTESDRHSNAQRIDEETNTSGVGSSQRNKQQNVGPLESDLEQLPSEKRRDRGGNQTGPGLG